MLERPDAANLLATAREVLLRSLLPALPPERHYEARMVANALAIAARAAGAAPAEADLGALARGIRAAPPAPGSAAYAALRQELRHITRLRCAVSAPRAMPADAGEDPPARQAP
jgi:hypothetical protein